MKLENMNNAYANKKCTNNIYINNRYTIEVTRKRIKNMYLRVKDTDGTLSVSAPYGMSDTEIRKFVESKSDGFTIKKMKTRWGSCNVKSHHLNFNLLLAKVPSECAEYVVVHELTHLLEPSHNARFWSLMEYYLPESKKLRKQLAGFSAQDMI